MSARAILAALSLAVACAAPAEPPAFEDFAPRELLLREEGFAASLPLDLSRRVPMVEAWVEGRGPYRFLVDTGAPFTSLTPALAAELGLAPAPHRLTDLRGVLGTARVRSIDLGGIALRDTLVVLSDSAATFGAQGVLGFSALLGCSARFDFPNARLELSRERLRGPADGRELLVDLGPPHRPMVELCLEGEGGARWCAAFLIDTGSDSGIFLPAGVEDLPFPAEPVGELEVMTVYGPARFELVRLQAVARLGALGLDRPVVTMRPRGPEVFPAEVGILGMRLLERAALTFDARSGLVRVQWRAPAAN
jgi:predicted aspartyl protease